MELQTSNKDHVQIIAVQEIFDLILNCCPPDLQQFLNKRGTNALLHKWIFDPFHLGPSLSEDYQRILEGLDATTETFPDEPWARCLRGRALWPLQYYNAAIQDFEKAIRYDYDELWFQLYLAETHYWLAEHSDRAQHHYRCATIHAGLAIRTHPHNARCYICRALSEAHLTRNLLGTSFFPERCRQVWQDIDLARQYARPFERTKLQVYEDIITNLLT